MELLAFAYLSAKGLLPLLSSLTFSMPMDRYGNEDEETE